MDLNIKLINQMYMLEDYLKRDIEEVDENIEHWKSRIERFGEKAVSNEKTKETYGDQLNECLEVKSYFVNQLENNNKLITQLKRKGEKEGMKQIRK